LTSRSDDAGETLLELVIAIAILGVAFVALLGGVLTAANLSGLHRIQADADTQLVSAVEQVKASSYVGTCAAGAPLYPVTLASGWTMPTQTVTYWNGTGFGTSCYDNLSFGYRTQQIAVTVRSADARVSRSVTILKRG
jgi:hypothetical protein